MISIIEILGTNKISASRPVINQNFFTLRDAVNGLLNNLNTVSLTDTNTLSLYTAVSTVSPLLRFQMDSNTGKLTIFDDDGLTPRIVLDKASNGSISLSNLNFTSSNIGSLSMPFPGSTANLRNCTVAEALINGSNSTTNPLNAAVMYNSIRLTDGTNTPIALSNVTSTYTLDLSTSFKNLVIINSLYTTGDGTAVTVSLGTLTENQADGLEVSIYNSGPNPYVLTNITYSDITNTSKTLKVYPSGYAKLRRVSTGLSATWVIVNAFNTTGV